MPVFDKHCNYLHRQMLQIIMHASLLLTLDDLNRGTVEFSNEIGRFVVLSLLAFGAVLEIISCHLLLGRVKRSSVDSQPH